MATTVAVTLSVADWSAEAAAAQPAPNATRQGQAKALEAWDVDSAQLTARARGARVEVLEARTETSSTFVNPDGCFTTDTASGPVRVKEPKPDRNGRPVWKDVDLTLVEMGDGSVAPRNHPAGLTLGRPTGSAEQSLATLSRSRGRSLELGWSGKLPRPVLDGTRATYPDVASGTDLVVEATRSGFEQFLSLRSADATASMLATSPTPEGDLEIRLPVATKGLVGRSDGKGGIEFVDSKGAVDTRVPAPHMWDARVDPGSGEPAAVAPVSMTFAPTKGKGAGEIVLTASKQWLTSADRVYPITIDPTAAQAVYSDTWVQTSYSTAQLGSTELKLGTYDGGATKARSFIKWNTAAWAGSSVSSATLSLWETHSYSCTAKNWQVYDTGAFSSTTVWSNQPAWSTLRSTSSATKGYSSSCADGWVTASATAWAQAAAAAGGVRTMGLRAQSETDSYGWKRFNSGNASTNVPKLSVTYNRYPNTPGTPTHTPGTSSGTSTAGWTTTTTPTLRATVSDPDGGSVRAKFNIYLNGATASPVVTGLLGSSVSSGGTSTATVPAGKLVNGSRYVVRAYAYDGSLTSKSWSSGYDNFTVDTAVPGVPTLTSVYPDGQWHNELGADGKIHLTAQTTATDAARVQWSVGTATYASTVTRTGAGTVDLAFAPTSDGRYPVYARVVDAAGNVSGGATYLVVHGDGVGLVQPSDSQVTARRLPVQLDIDPALVSSLGSPSLEYRRGNADTWKAVPLTHLFDGNATTPLTSWPSSANPDTVWAWDAAATLGGGGVVQLRARFTNGSMTASRTATVDVNAGGAAFREVGPASVNQLTGEASLSATDASLFGLSVGRSYGSRSLTNGADNANAGAFGPQWAPAGLSGSDTGYTAVRRTSDTSVDVLLDGQDAVSFTLTAAGGTQWEPEPGSEDLALTGSLTGSRFVLSSTDGSGAVFDLAAGTTSGSGLWPVSSATAPGAGNTTLTGYTVVDGTARATRAVAANPALSSSQLAECRTTDFGGVVDFDAKPYLKGCRVLTTTWETVPSSAAPSGSASRVTSLQAWVWDEQAGKVAPITVATYTYDARGWLTSVTDPRPAKVPGGRALTTSYEYAADGRVVKVTPPGELPWTLSYAAAGPVWDRDLRDAAGNNTSQGRLVSVSRPTLAAGTADQVSGTVTSTVVYGVPLTAALGPADLSAAATQAWGQSTAPSDATALFDGLDPADSNVADRWALDDTSRRNWSGAEVTYLDVSGRQVNTLAPGGRMDAVQYDAQGNEVLSLTPGNRALAMGQGPGAQERLAELGLDGLASATRAQLLSSATGYEVGAGGDTRVAWAQGPVSVVTLPDGSAEVQRATTRYQYDEGRPTPPSGESRPSNLVTTTTVGGLGIEDGYDPAKDALSDARTTRAQYDWVLGVPTTTTTDPSSAAGDEIVRTVAYDEAGRPTKTAQPKGGDAGTRLTTYYQGQTTGPCANQPQFGGLVCQTKAQGPAAGSGSLTNPELATSTITYNRMGSVAKAVDVANGATRTVTSQYDEADRPRATSFSASASLGAVPSTKTYTYDAATGAQESTSSATVNPDGTATSKTVTVRMDQLGRPLSYQESGGLLSVTSYDALDRPVSTSLTGQVGTGNRTYVSTATYDPVTGRQASSSDPRTGSTTLAYDLDDNIVSQAHVGALAHGLTMRQTFEPTGQPSERVWTMDDPAGSDTPVELLSERVGSNIHGQWRDHSTMEGGHRDYRYDGVGRLTSATDLVGSSCTVRSYRLDANSNRTGKSVSTAEATADGNGDLVNCPAAVTPDVDSSQSFDTADRLVKAGYAYDAMGRTVRLPDPTSDSGAVLKVGYHANDLVASQAVFATAAAADADNGSGDGARVLQTWDLDVTGNRLASSRTVTRGTDESGAPVTTTVVRRNLYASLGDAPAWIDEDVTGSLDVSDPAAGSVTRYVVGPGNEVVASVAVPKAGPVDGSADAVSWSLTNLHGDAVASLPADTAEVAQVSGFDEFGVSDGDSGRPRYGWLGAKQRSGEAQAGLYLMGVRLYDPSQGRFLSVDPVFGGNDNAYVYPADPVNGYDLDGRFSYWTKLALKGVKAAINLLGKGCGRVPNPLLAVGCAMLTGGIVGVIGKYLSAGTWSVSATTLMWAFIGGAGAGLWATYGRYFARFLFSTSLGRKIWDRASSVKGLSKVLYKVLDWMTERGYR